MNRGGSVLASAVRSRFAGSPRLAAVVRKFGKRLEERLPEFDQALREGDLVALAHLAHWLRGSAGTVGFDAFTAPTTRLEQAAKVGDLEGSSSALNEVMDLARRIELPPEAAKTTEPGSTVEALAGIR